MELCLKPEGNSDDTKRVNSAIQDLKSTGGILKFGAGPYRLGTVVLESNIQILFEPGVEIYYSKNEDDFLEGELQPYDTFADRETSTFRFALFYGEEIENLSIQGPAKIINEYYPRGGPKPIALKSSINITLKDFTIERAPNYSISLIDCEYVAVSDLKIFNALCDGIDLDGCRMVQITNCIVDSWDDGICLKSSMATGKKLMSRNIMIMNCSVSSSCNCFKIGTETHGDFQDITINNCTFPPRGFQRQAQSAIAIESTDGSTIQGLTINNCISRAHKCLLFIQLGNRLRAAKIGQSTPGSITYINISNIMGESLIWPIIISGLKEKHIENVRITNIFMNFRLHELHEFEKTSLQAIETAASTQAIDAKYPDPEMFGGFPSSILFIRNASNVFIQDALIHGVDDFNHPHIAISASDSIYLSGAFHGMNKKRINLQKEIIESSNIDMVM